MNEPVSCVSGETYFFRDHGQFDLLRLRLLPELIARRRGLKSLRLWSAACASGEEAYSLAILIDRILPEPNDWKVQIIGSDINPIALAQAENGRYRQWSFRSVSPVLQQRYFQRQGDEWVLSQRIRRMVGFRRIDLVGQPISDPELQDMDLILCRNLFIYFDADTVTRVATKLAGALNEGGYLMTAHAELIGLPIQNMQSRLFAEGVVYQRAFSRPAESLPLVRVLPLVAEPVQPVPAPPAGVKDADDLLATARNLADRGEYDQAERICSRLLTDTPLAVAPYFLLAQLAQLKGDFERAAELLDQTLYLDPGCVAATLERAALCERAENRARAQALRRVALDLVRGLPGDMPIEPYEMTAAEMAQWLAP